MSFQPQLSFIEQGDNTATITLVVKISNDWGRVHAFLKVLIDVLVVELDKDRKNAPAFE